MGSYSELVTKVAVIAVSAALFGALGGVLLSQQFNEHTYYAYLAGGLMVLIVLTIMNEVTYRLTGRQAFQLGRLINGGDACGE